jgi:hypothetical protein
MLRPACAARMRNLSRTSSGRFLIVSVAMPNMYALLALLSILSASL